MQGNFGAGNALRLYRFFLQPNRDVLELNLTA